MPPPPPPDAPAPPPLPVDGDVGPSGPPPGYDAAQAYAAYPEPDQWWVLSSLACIPLPCKGLHCRNAKCLYTARCERQPGVTKVCRGFFCCMASLTGEEVALAPGLAEPYLMVLAIRSLHAQVIDCLECTLVLHTCFLVHYVSCAAWPALLASLLTAAPAIAACHVQASWWPICR